MNRLVAFFSFAGLVAPLAAQNFLYLPASGSPNTLELGGFDQRPFMQTNSRVQMFFDATETGSSAFIATGLSLRYDGPIPRVGAPGPFTIQRLHISVGTTTTRLPGSVFAQNLTQPLVTVLDGPWSYLPDPGSAAPHGWGDPNNSLTFPFTNQAAIAIPAGGWFVVDLQMTGNDIASFGFSHAILDGMSTGVGLTDGSATSFGLGCSATTGGPPATMMTSGIHAPGGTHFLSAQNLGASTLALALIGLSNTNSNLGALPFNLAGTNCDLLVSPDFYMIMTTNAAGAIPAGNGTAFSIPANPVFSGGVLYEQFLSVVPTANAPWGAVLSDARAVTLGSVTPPSIGAWVVSHGSDADAQYADLVKAFGYAVRIQTL